MACIRNDKTNKNIDLTFPCVSTNCIRFKGYFSAQGTPKVFCKPIVFFIESEMRQNYYTRMIVFCLSQ